MCPQTLEPIVEEDTSQRRKRKDKNQRATARNVQNIVESKDDVPGADDKMVSSTFYGNDLQDYFPDEILTTPTPKRSPQIGVRLPPNEKILGSSPPFCPPDVSPALQIIHRRFPLNSVSPAPISPTSP